MRLRIKELNLLVKIQKQTMNYTEMISNEFNSPVGSFISVDILQYDAFTELFVIIVNTPPKTNPAITSSAKCI